VATFCALAARGQLCLLTLFSLPLSAQIVKKVDFPYQADLIVCEVLYEYQADVLVFTTDKKYELRKDKCFWYFTTKSYEADYTMYFTEYQYRADLKVYFVDQKYKARWRSEEKRKLLQ
jgi:hypothetical protein